MSDKGRIEELIATFSGNDYYEMYRATQVLAQIGVLAVEPLIAVLSHQKSIVRKLAAETLGNIKDRRAFEPLLELLHQDDSSFVREYAAKALCKFGDGAVIKPILNNLPGPDADELWDEFGEIGSELAASFSEMGTPIIEFLVEELVTRKFDFWRTEWLAEALENIGTPEALAAVAAWRKSQNH